MHVVRDLLDRLIVDRDGREMGRVDGLVLECEEGAPPRLAALLIGPSVLAHRLHPRLGRFVRALEQRAGLSDRPTQVPLEASERIHGRIMLRISIRETSVDAIEQRFRTWLTKLPGSR
jgi:sporulation protein YlmC with PRC-barrel domain